MYKPPGKPVVFDSDRARIQSFVLGSLLVRHDPIETMTTRTLKRTADQLKLNIGGCIEKDEIRKKVKVRRNDRCPICLHDFDSSEQVAQTSCGHSFCAPCLVEALESRVLNVGGDDAPPCPLCKCPIHVKN